MSVAQTTVPGEFLPFVKVGDELFGAAHFPWSGSVDDDHSYFTGSIQYGDGALQNTNGCEPFEEGSLEGKVVLVDRGSWFFSNKVLNAENAGAVATLVANNVEGAPFPGGFGGGTLYPTIPALMVSLDDGDAIREMIMLNIVEGDDSTIPAATIDVQNFRPTALMTMGSSARGPDMSFNRIKPEIAAPGGNLVVSLLELSVICISIPGFSSNAYIFPFSYHPNLILSRRRNSVPVMEKQSLAARQVLLPWWPVPQRWQSRPVLSAALLR